MIHYHVYTINDGVWCPPPLRRGKRYPFDDLWGATVSARDWALSLVERAPERERDVLRAEMHSRADAVRRGILPFFPALPDWQAGVCVRINGECDMCEG